MAVRARRFMDAATVLLVIVALATATKHFIPSLFARPAKKTATAPKELTAYEKEAESERVPPETRFQIEEGKQSIGRPDAIVTIVVFNDYGCGHCAIFHTTIEHLQRTLPEHVRLIVRSFLPTPKAAQWTMHLAAACAADQGQFEAFNNAIFAHQRFTMYRDGWRKLADSIGVRDRHAFDKCVLSEKHASDLRSDTELAKALGIVGTPTSFVNGRIVVGDAGAARMDSIVAYELDRHPTPFVRSR